MEALLTLEALCEALQVAIPALGTAAAVCYDMHAAQKYS